MEYFEAFIFESIDIRAFFIAAIYFLLSFALPFLNKTLLVTFNFHGIIFLLLIQCLVTISMLDIISNFVTIFTRKVSMTDCLTCWKLSLYSCGNVYFSLHSLRGLNIAVIDMIKRLGPLVNLFLSGAVLQRKVALDYSSIAIAMTTFGCIIGIVGTSLGKSTLGLYGLVFIAVILQSLYQTEAERLGAAKNFSSWDMLYINSVNSLPVLLFLAILTWSEFSKIFHSELWQDHTFVFLFLLVVFCGFFLNASLFACLKHNTAITTSVVGTLKGILAAFVSLFGFDKPKVGHQFLVGLSMNLVGALSYIHAKLLAQRAK